MPRATGALSRACHAVAALATLTLLAYPDPAAAGPAPDGPAQEEESPKRQKPFAGEARVLAVEVPVTVTDRSGEPVRGLTADDFEILDEGVPRPVTGFEMVDLTSEETAELPAEDLPSSARRHFLLLFDISFSDPTSVLRARIAARDFALKHLHPTDLLAVATYSLETGPRLVLTFTPDRAQVAHAIDSLGLHYRAELDPLRFLIAPTDRPEQDISTGLDSGAPGNITGGLEGGARELLRVLAEQMDRGERSFKAGQITYFARSMGEMARHLAAVKGRKHVVFFSEGFDSRLLTGDPLSDLAATGDDRNLLIQRGSLWRVDSDDLYGNTGLQRKLREMITEFRRADCVIQAVDIGGLRADGSVRAEGPLDAGHEGLFYMAHETGGELFKDANNLEGQLQEVLARNAVTYVLTFQPQDLAYDGTFHRLKVKLKGKRGDLRLSYRQGYYEPRPFRELHPLEKDLLASDAIASARGAEDLAVSVLTAPFRATPEWAYLPVIVEVDGGDLLVDHTGDLMAVELYAYATNAEGEMSGFFTEQLTVDLAKGRKLLVDRGLKYYGHLELPPGDYRLRVLVRNSHTGRSTVRSVQVRVPAYISQEAMVLPPFFLDEPAGWLMVRERADGQRGDSTIYPFTVKGRPYVPAAKPRLARGEDAQLCLVAYNLSNGDLSLDAEVTTAEGHPVEGGKLRLQERTATGIDGYDKLLASFRPAGLSAGEYTLKVALTEETTGRSQVNSIPFHVFK